MSKLNLTVNLNTYSDARGSNAPNLQNFKWNRAVSGIDVESALSMSVTIAAGETLTVPVTAAKLVYIEVSALARATFNGTIVEDIKPIVINSSTLPGISLKTSDITSLTIENPSTTDEITVFVAAVE